LDEVKRALAAIDRPAQGTQPSGPSKIKPIKVLMREGARILRG
jgi:hypothetical protein